MDTKGGMAMAEPIKTTLDAEPVLCPSGAVFDLVAHKWTVSIIHRLDQAGGPIRFRELQRQVGPITQKELTKRLREMERSGLVTRTVFAEVPPRVEYRLTELGATLLPALAPLDAWAEQYGPIVHENRRRADAASGRDG
jgi:DNA-binding HxlR family transcriptional regulator